MENISTLVDGALDTAIELFSNIEVREENMKKNLDALGGLIYSEALMMKLGKKMGRIQAHDVIHELAQESMRTGRNYSELLMEDERVGKYITKRELEEIMDPARHIGLAEHFVDAVTQNL